MEILVIFFLFLMCVRPSKIDTRHRRVLPGARIAISEIRVFGISYFEYFLYDFTCSLPHQQVNFKCLRHTNVSSWKICASVFDKIKPTNVAVSQGWYYTKMDAKCTWKQYRRVQSPSKRNINKISRVNLLLPPSNGTNHYSSRCWIKLSH